MDSFSPALLKWTINGDPHSLSFLGQVAQAVFDKNNKKQNVSNFISIIYRSDHGGHEGRGDGSLPVIASPRNPFWVQTLSRL